MTGAAARKPLIMSAQAGGVFGAGADPPPDSTDPSRRLGDRGRSDRS
ncbi:MAG TPA: hypothetical protein VN408_02900 [Actinoplanes sp.]|nr:hypothetical protein [Actinoplanes sp.]